MKTIFWTIFTCYFLGMTVFFSMKVVTAFWVLGALWKEGRKQFPKFFDGLVPVSKNANENSKQSNCADKPLSELAYLERLARTQFTINALLAIGCLLFGNAFLGGLLELLGK